MWKWWKRKRLERKNRLEKKLKQQLQDALETLGSQMLLDEIKTKQFNDFMVESEQRVHKFRKLLEEEKNSNGKLLKARQQEIGELKNKNLLLQKEINSLTENNTLLKTTLGHF